MFRTSVKPITLRHPEYGKIWRGMRNEGDAHNFLCARIGENHHGVTTVML